MSDGLQFNVSFTEYALSAILIVVLALGVGYEATHRAYPPVAAAPCPPPTVTVTSPPTIEIHETIYVPVPYSSSKDTQLPDELTPDPNLEKPEQDQNDPVFEHRTPIITDALREPMTYAKNQ